MHSYEDYLEATGEGELSQLNALAEQQAEAARVVLQKEKELNEAREVLRDLSERQVPEAMDAVGMAEFTTRSGITIKVAETVRASIPKPMLAKALRWLRDNGHGALIKRTITAQFGKGEEEQANEVLAALQHQGLNLKDDAKVHPSTLSAFVREKLEQGEEVPQDLLGVHRQRVAKIA